MLENRGKAILSSDKIETTVNVKIEKERFYSTLLDKSLRIFFWNAFKICTRNPAQAYAFARTVQYQIKAGKVRAKYTGQGIHVPPMMIISVTNQCNLHCKGCYNWTLRSEQKQELSEEKLRSVLTEASELGISFIIFAGGEPLLRSEIMDIATSYPHIQFLMFTNGTLLDDKVTAFLEKHRNVVPVISLEGNQVETDGRRGLGIYNTIKEKIGYLKHKNIFWGTSLTVTRKNISVVCDELFIRELTGLSCQLFFFMEYSPVMPGTEDWVITEKQRKELSRKVTYFRDNFPALFVNLPGDEGEFGGCLAAGRGFIHVSASGNVEPCPFVPLSDKNLNDVSLKEALQSDFLETIRENSDKLEEEPGGCSLWDKKEWLNSVLLH